jgi:hypothetical protein
VKSNLNKHDKYLGEYIKITLKRGGGFNMYVTGNGPGFLEGRDDERQNARVATDGIKEIEVIRR